MSPIEVKAEYYGLLKVATAGVMKVVDWLRGTFRDGLVDYVNGNFTVGPHDIADHEGRREALIPVMDDAFDKKLSALQGPQSFEPALHTIFGAFRRTLFIAGDVWHRDMDPSDPTYQRMMHLIGPEFIEKYGPVYAVQRRVAAATAETINIASGFQGLIVAIFLRDQHRLPTREEITRIYNNSKKLALLLSASHISINNALANIARPARTDESRAELASYDALFCIRDDELVLVGEELLPVMAMQSISVQDGRFTCPGRPHISPLWDWYGEVSERYTFRTLK